MGRAYLSADVDLEQAVRNFERLLADKDDEALKNLSREELKA